MSTFRWLANHQNWSYIWKVTSFAALTWKYEKKHWLNWIGSWSCDCARCHFCTDEIKLQFSELEDLSITNFVKYFEQKTEIDQNGMAKIWDICASIRDPDNETIDLKTFCIMFYFAKLVNKDIELPKQVSKYWIKLLN